MNREGRNVDTLRYSSLDETQNNSGTINVKLFNTAVDPPTAAKGWIVRFSLEHDGVPIPNATSTSAWLVDEQNRRSAEDTAGTDGVAGRRLHVAFPAGGILNELADSVVVIATATHRGTPLAGSPVRVVVQIRPKLP